MPNDPNTCRIELCRVTGDDAMEDDDEVAVEEPLEIQIGLERKGIRSVRSVSVTMRTPGQDDELAIGFLFGEALLNRPSDVAGIEFPASEDGSAGIVRIQLRPGVGFDPRQLERHFYTSSSCGICGKASLEAVRRMARRLPPGTSDDVRISSATVHRLPGRLRESQQIFGHTGGLHAAALFDLGGNLCSIREDVGRHNAVDKVIGAEWLDGHTPLNDKILFVSGRASFELVQKAARAGIPVFAAVGAPSSLAVELAEACRITLLGFVRNTRFNVYSGRSRLNTFPETSASTPLS